MCSGVVTLSVYPTPSKLKNQPDHVVRLIFQLAWCGIHTQSNNTTTYSSIFILKIVKKHQSFRLRLVYNRFATTVIETQTHLFLNLS